jgi:TatD DNase family protein
VVDTHCHLDACEPPDGELLLRAREAGITRLATVGTDQGSVEHAVGAAKAHAAVFAIVGRHPHEAGSFDARERDLVYEWAHARKVCAIGETGLDYYRDRSPREDQRRAFEAQVEIARRVGKPVVIHMRESVEDTFALLRSEADGVAVILHCFSAPPERAGEAAERGWFCSFAGNITYPKAEGLREAAALVPEELLLVETDSPFLAPQPVRGKPNRPANVVATAEQLAEVRGVSYGELEATVEANAARVFRW